jgi:WD40 repeat protein
VSSVAPSPSPPIVVSVESASPGTPSTLTLTDPPRVEELALDPALEKRDTGEDRGFHGIAVTPGGAFALEAHGRMPTLWHMALGREWDRFLGHLDVVEAVAISPNGKTALSASDDATVRLWTCPAGEMLAIYVGHRGPVSAIAYSSDGKLMITGGGRGQDRSVRLWPLDEARRPVPRTPPRVESSHELGSHGSQVLAVMLTPSGHRALSAERFGKVKTFDARLGYGELTSLDAGVGYLSAAVFGREGHRLLVGAEDGRVALIQLEGKWEPRVLGQHDSNVAGIAFSPDGGFAVTTGKDRTLRIWNLTEGREVSRLRTLHELWSPEFLPDGSAVLARLPGGALARVALTRPAR